MSLSNIISGPIQKPSSIILYGMDSVGKTSWAAEAPSPIFIDLEDGSHFLDVKRYEKPKKFSDITKYISELLSEKHEFKTLVIDSLDFLEPLVWSHTCKENGWKDIEQPGYGRGYVAALDVWRMLLSSLNTLKEERKMNIIAIAHSMIKPFNDPAQLAAYDRYIIKLQEKAAALWRESMDCVFFCTFEMYIKTDAGKKTKALGGSTRIMHTQRTAAFDAKCRFGLPAIIPLSWEEYEKAATGGKDHKKIKENIILLLNEIKDEALKKKVMTATEKAGINSDELEKVLNRLQTVINT